MVLIQPLLAHSPDQDTSSVQALPPTRAHTNEGTAALQVDEGDLQEFCLSAPHVTLFGVYHVWVHQNPGTHLDGGIKEDIKWQKMW